jgi:hypothetical protein
MAEQVSDIVTEIISQGSFDATSADVVKWLNRRHKEMVCEARGYRKALTVGTTTANLQEYNLPVGVVELYDVTVGGLPYGKGRRSDIADSAQGWLWLSGPGGEVVESASASAVTTLALIPAPLTSGDTIAAFAAVSPPDLLIDNSVPFVVDGDFIEGLMAGVFATALNRPNEGRPDLAATQQAIFEDAKAKYSRRVTRRMRGPGPSRIRVALPGGAIVS